MYSLIYIRTHVIGNYSVKVRKAFPLIEFLHLQYDVPPFLSTRHVWDTHPSHGGFIYYFFRYILQSSE